MRPSITALLLLALTFPPGQAIGKTSGVAVARHHEQEARELFNLGRFGQAAAEYEAAYRARPLPPLLFNLAQCYMRMEGPDNWRRAIHQFEAYLKSVPDARNRKGVEEQIAKLETRIGAAARPPTPKVAARPELAPVLAPGPFAAPTAIAPAQPSNPAAATPVYRRWWFWTIVGAVVIGGATAVAVVSTRDRTEIPRLPWHTFE